MTDQLYQRATILLQQKRYNEAAKMLGELVTSEPNNTRYLALYAETLLELQQNQQALDMLNTALGLAPDLDYLYYLKARVMLALNKYQEAEDQLNRAIEIDPSDADYYAVLAAIKLDRKQYQAALDLANHALQLQPNNLMALNLRSSALVKLDKKNAAFSTIEGALRENPNSAHTHANYGWGQLEKGSPKKALEHFTEALKNDPTSLMAQAGMQEALKAQYLPYRWFLKYAFWIGNMSSKYQWGIIIGFYLLANGINRLANNNPALAPFLYPVIILYSLMAFSTWIIAPISNLFLRLNPYGKHLLNKNETRASTLVGICVAISIVALAIFLLSQNIGWAFLAALAFTYMIPASMVFKPSGQKTILVIAVIALLAVGLFAALIAFRYQLFQNKIGMYYLYGLIGFQFLSNFLLIKEDRV